jgi:predicted Fe-Mo cluster-binding NifX family protein
MKIAIPCKVDCDRSPLEERFGRSRHFAIFDQDTSSCEFVTLSEFIDGGSAGLFIAKQLIDKGVDVVIAGMIGPNVEQAFREANIKIIPNQYGNISDILKEYRKYQDRLI